VEYVLDLCGYGQALARIRADVEEECGSTTDDDEQTVVYHTEMWGFFLRGEDRGGLQWWEDGYESESDEDSDSETVVGEWFDPHMTPMKRYAPIAAEYFN